MRRHIKTECIIMIKQKVTCNSNLDFNNMNRNTLITNGDFKFAE